MSSDVHALELPSMLDDKYRVESLLAVGGMGAVYRGTHTRLKKTVAIKVLKRELLGSPDLVERFQREAIAASQIGHEGIIEVTDIGTSKAGDPFLVMEFLQGQDLATCLKELGPLRAATAARLGVEILSALAAAHDKSIIHRDMKPENVFVCQRSRGECLKIVDFGISRMPIDGEGSMRLTSTGVVMGTPYYMSPEQALGESSIGITADIYSVGVILYELITGAVPFQATNYNALLHQILSGEYSRPSRLADVSPELEAVICKAMSIRPQERYGNARSFADALRRFSEVTPTSLLQVHTPFPDTSDDNDPLAYRGTAVSSQDEDFSTSATQIGSGDDGSDTLKPVVTPLPPPSPSSSRQRTPALAIGAVLALIIAGGTTAVLAGMDAGDSTASEPASAATAINAEPAQELEPPRPPPAEEAHLVALSFAVAPHDAQVFVDGLPITGTRIERPVGTYVIEVRREGFASQARTVHIAADEKLAFALEASKSPPTDVVAPTPAAERSGKRKGKTSRPVSEPTQKATTETSPGNRRFVEDSPYDAP